MKRTPAEVGALVRQRRDILGLSQESIPDVSDSLIRQIEQGEAPRRGRGGRRQAFMAALGWPPDALARLAAGEDPDRLTPGEANTPTSSGTPTGSDLRDLLGVGGQVVQDELDEIKARLDRLEGVDHPGKIDEAGRRILRQSPSNATPRLRVAKQTQQKAIAELRAHQAEQAPAEWVYAAGQDDGQPASDDLSKMPSTSLRPTRKSFDPDDPDE